MDEGKKKSDNFLSKLENSIKEQEKQYLRANESMHTRDTESPHSIPSSCELGFLTFYPNKDKKLK